MPTYEFIEVGKTTFNKPAGNGQNALYHYKILKVTKGITMRASFTDKELKPLMFHFGVEKPEDLAGKSFKSPRETATSALNLLIIQIRHGGEYKPPKPQMLYDALAASLAKFQIPDFSNVDEQTIYDSFSAIFEGSKIKPKWFDWLKEEIWARSNGRLLLKRADAKEFKMHIMGPAEYLVLIDQGLPFGKPPGDERRLVIGPYTKPAFFDAEK